MQGNDFYSGSALGGATTGAATGAMAGSSAGPYGALLGGLVGGGIGLFTGASANASRDQGVQGQQKNIDAAIAQMRQASSDNYAAHLANLNKALAFYGPANDRWNYLYGTSTGQGNFPTNPKV